MATTTKKLTDDPVVRRIVQLTKDRGKREKDLTEYLGLSPGAMSKWKYDGSYVYIKYIYEICEFLDTTPNYLFFGPEDEEERLSSSEKDIIRTYRSLDDERKKYIQDTFMYIAKGNRKRKRKNLEKDVFVEKPLL